MDSLKRAMKWDEDVFGLEYDLDVFNIVAVSDFNFGAMENKSLNIFNAQYILASPETATDSDYERIEAVVAHEYFHNWTGNRVTCRDWFQLSLKEGLTVYRDQEFSADMRGAAIRRIADIRTLRARQFPEDAGPLAHPVRPPSYLEIANFYTATIYEKGAEVIRMMAAILGRAGFFRGHALYIARHDGQAARIEDFVAAMEDANNADLTAFKYWYDEAGTPEVHVAWHYDQTQRALNLELRQENPPSPGQTIKHPKVIPINIGLMSDAGADLPVTIEGEGTQGPATRTMILDQAHMQVRLINIDQAPVISLNRGFSAPVKIHADYSDDDLLFLMAHDSDPVARFESGQSIGLKLLLQASRTGAFPALDRYIGALGQTLVDPKFDHAFIADAITLPSERYIADQLDVVDPQAIFHARESLRRSIADALHDRLHATYQKLASNEAFSTDAGPAGRRALRNAVLGYLTAPGDQRAIDLARAHYDRASNMTDRLAGLSCLSRIEGDMREQALDDFLARYTEDSLVVDKWFNLQALSPLPTTLDRVITLSAHPLFTVGNPNKVRALIGAFSASNPVRFHETGGRGYRFLGEWIEKLDRTNPQLAARLAEPLCQWRRFMPAQATLMQAELIRLANLAALSKDCREIISKALD
jgi:aminopeptidase N